MLFTNKLLLAHCIHFVPLLNYILVILGTVKPFIFTY